MAAGRIRRYVSYAEIAVGGAFLALASFDFLALFACLGLPVCGSGIPTFPLFIGAAWLIPSGLLLRQSDYFALFGHAIWFCILCALFG